MSVPSSWVRRLVGREGGDQRPSGDQRGRRPSEPQMRHLPSRYWPVRPRSGAVAGIRAFAASTIRVPSGDQEDPCRQLARTGCAFPPSSHDVARPPLAGRSRGVGDLLSARRPAGRHAVCGGSMSCLGRCHLDDCARACRRDDARRRSTVRQGRTPRRGPRGRPGTGRRDRSPRRSGRTAPPRSAVGPARRACGSRG
jgi:hypothetical protein